MLNNGTQENMAVFHDQARSKEDTYETKLQLGQGGQGGQLKLENTHRYGWVNFITTSLFSRTLESWLRMEIIPKWP